MYLKDNEKEVPIERHFLDKIIGFLVNFEMGFLAIACLIIYIVKSWEHYTNSIGHFLAFSFSIIATILICSFCISALNYSKMSSYYLEKWKEKKIYCKKLKRRTIRQIKILKLISEFSGVSGGQQPPFLP